MDLKKIIIADPSEDDSEKLIKALHNAGYDVLVFRSGEDVYTASVQKQPSIILSELYLPVLNGIQLFHKVRNNYLTHHIPFVIVTREKDRQERIKSMQLGIDDYISKPYYVEEVVAKIEMLLSETEALEETKKSLEHGFAGSLREMNLVDLIQIFEVGDKSAILRLSRNGHEGVVYIEKGRVQDAAMDQLEPNTALKSMLTWIEGKFFVELQKVSRQKLIKLSNKEIFEYGTMKMHQWRQLAHQLPPLETILTISESSNLDSLSEEETTVAQMFRGGSSIRAVVEANKIDDLLLLKIIRRLLERQVLTKSLGSNQSEVKLKVRAQKKSQHEIDKNENGLYKRISSFFKKERKNGYKYTLEQSKSIYDQLEKVAPEPIPIRRKIYLTKGELLLIRQKLV